MTVGRRATVTVGAGASETAGPTEPAGAAEAAGAAELPAKIAAKVVETAGASEPAATVTPAGAAVVTAATTDDPAAAEPSVAPGAFVHQKEVVPAAGAPLAPTVVSAGKTTICLVQRPSYLVLTAGY